MTISSREFRRLLGAYLRRLPVICMLILISLSRDVLGQNSEGGSISGKVTDSWQGNPVPAAIVTVRGTTLATQTDGQGSYLVPGVQPGNYTVIVTKNGYERVVVDDVKVAIGVTTKADAKLGPIFFELDAFQAITEPIQEQKLEILETRKKQVVVMDALGADYISQIGASDATDVAKKITGVTIQEGKFVVVRGLSDRYTSTTMNGADIPSADSDKQAAQLDLIPADMIKRMEVRKTFTPDMPGGFAGGAVNIVTKTFPDRFTFNFSAGATYNANNNLVDDFAGSVRSDTDFIAIDDGLREVPEELGLIYDALDRGAASGQVFPITHPTSGIVFQVPVTGRGQLQHLNNPLYNDWWRALTGRAGADLYSGLLSHSEPLADFGPVETTSGLDSGFSLSVGDNYTILGKESGFFAGFNYDRGFTGNTERRGQRFDAVAAGSGVPLANALAITNGVTSVKWGGSFATGIRPSEGHEIGFNYSRVQAAEDFRATLYHVNANEDRQEYQGLYRERELQGFQLFGRHEFPELADLGFEWTTSLADVSQDDPGAQRYLARQLPNGTFESGGNIQPKHPVRTWREISENNFNNRVDFDLPYTIRETLEGKISFGGYHSKSGREYREIGYAYNNNVPNVADGVVNLANATANNIPIIQPSGLFDYDGDRLIEAAYLMTELPVTDWMKLVGGARLEKTDLVVESKNLETGAIRTSPKNQIDYLPALGAVFSPSEKFKVTLHWSQTIARATYREIAEATFTDFENLRFIFGNPDLNFSASENYDVRLEYFPKEGEVISGGFFYKTITDPIEIQQENSEFANFKYVNPNSGEALVLGAEFEYRRSLEVLSDHLKNYSVGANFAYIYSQVENTGNIVGQKGEAYVQYRPLFDQSPIVANADLSYSNPRLRLDYTLAFNFYDRRLSAIVPDGPDIYEDSVASLDFSISKKFGRKGRWKVKLSARNLLDPTISRSVDKNLEHLLAPGVQPFYDSYRRGRSYGMSVSYSF